MLRPDKVSLQSTMLFFVIRVVYVCYRCSTFPVSTFCKYRPIQSNKVKRFCYCLCTDNTCQGNCTTVIVTYGDLRAPGKCMV